jgi:hypothetical protein
MFIIRQRCARLAAYSASDTGLGPLPLTPISLKHKLNTLESEGIVAAMASNSAAVIEMRIPDATSACSLYPERPLLCPNRPLLGPVWKARVETGPTEWVVTRD